MLYEVITQSAFLVSMYTVYNVYVLLRAIYVPFEQNFISDYAGSGSYGRIMGIRQAFVSIGMIIGPVVGGFLYAANPIYVFDASAVLFFIAFLLFLIIYRRFKKPQKAV